MADAAKKGRVRKPQPRQPQAPTGPPTGAPGASRAPRGGADGGTGTRNPPPRTHPPNPLPPGQVMAYPQHQQHPPHPQQHPQQHPQHHPQHPQHPQRMGLPGVGFQHPPPPPPPPPAFFPGSASLFEQLDKRVMVVLRDGRHLVGVMRSYDQFSNIVLEDTHERHFVGDMFGDIALGLYLVRGDALVLMGELDSALEETPTLKKVSADEIIEAQQEASTEERQDAKLDWLFQDLS